VANRTVQRAHELVATFGVRAVVWDDLDAELATTDVVITCTGASGVVFDRQRIAAASAGHPLTFVDLALPRDVDPSATLVEGVTVIDLVVLGERAEHAELAADVEQVREIVEDEVRTFLAAKSASSVTPTVVALRSMATDVVEAELARISTRMPALREEEVEQVRRSLQRVADKLIHAPTVRVQQLVEGPAGLTYADALADLFALDQAAVEAVTRVGGEEQ
jgi:glutamyl-tRNA reductase